jgi:hypothetical protein
MVGIIQELNKILETLDRGSVGYIQLIKYQWVVKRILEREPKNPLALYLKARLLILATKPQDHIKIKNEILNIVNEMATIAHSPQYYYRKFSILDDLKVDDTHVYQERKKACVELLKIPPDDPYFVYHLAGERFLNYCYSLENPIRKCNENVTEENPPDYYGVINPTGDSNRNIGNLESSDPVHFSVSSPFYVSLNSTFILNIWAHLGDQYDEIERRAFHVSESHERKSVFIESMGPKRITRGVEITFRPIFKHFTLEKETDSVEWTGDIASVNFIVNVPESIDVSDEKGKIEIYIDRLKIGEINFKIRIHEMFTSYSRTIPTEDNFYHCAFVSYSSEDEERVQHCIYGLKKARGAMEIFYAPDSIRSGEMWKQKIRQAIEKADVFYLFWSVNAMKSEWVNKEWRCAYNLKGKEFINPFPLDSPKEAPPPFELSDIHFDDPFRRTFNQKPQSSTNQYPDEIVF